MKWFQKILHKRNGGSGTCLLEIQDKFRLFRMLLDKNNHALKIISDLEEKSQGEYLFDLNYITSSLQDLRAAIGDIIDNMIIIGGDDYLPLKERFTEIDSRISAILPGDKGILEDELTIRFDEITAERSWSIGSKNAQLGEIKAKLGLPVPDGFAITSWAYKKFMDSSGLQGEINSLLEGLNPNNYNELVAVSTEIRHLLMETKAPDSLVKAIEKRCKEMSECAGSCRFAFRSSALGEDSQFSFAGRYATFLNVHQSDLVEKYVEIIASKFTPKAIYYFLSHGLNESHLAMGVGCLRMIDASASGVVYTHDPVNPENDSIMVNSVFGLGNRIVDGTVNADIFRISRHNKSIVESAIAEKHTRLVADPNGGIREIDNDDEVKMMPSLNHEQLEKLSEYALRIEEHYGCPQDIEWAADEDGDIYVLQARPLRIIKRRQHYSGLDFSNLTVLRKAGTTVCPGAGAGQVFYARGPEDLPRVPKDSVLFASRPFPGLVTVLDHVRALVTEVGGSASHMATIAREFRIPTVAGVSEIESIEIGRSVTVDATSGTIYDGIQPEVVEARKKEYDMFEDSELFQLLARLLRRISPLNLLHPSAPDFEAKNCQTFHDITRFCHQKSIEEMFTGAKELEGKEHICCKLQSDIPLNVNFIYLDQDQSKFYAKRLIQEADIASDPMHCYWNGIKKEGWPKTPPANFRGLASAVSSDIPTRRNMRFSQNSYAILSKEYMIASLRMGYHFTTVEAMVTNLPSKNYIRMQYKDGGASLDRRVRRIRLIMNLLTQLGFEHHSTGDFLDSAFSYGNREETCKKLYLIGRITMMTKQLDMALSNDKVAEWYYLEFMRKLEMS